MYTEETLSEYLWAQKLQGKSLRELAREFGGCINYGDIQRCLKGDFPQKIKKRVALKLKTQALADVCPKCGEVHVTRRCTRGRQRIGNRINEWPVEVLRWKLVNREEVE